MQRTSARPLLPGSHGPQPPQAVAAVTAQHQNDFSNRSFTALSPTLAHVLQEVQRTLSARAEGETDSNVDLSETELLRLIDGSATKLGIQLTSLERDEVLAHLESSQRPFGILQELVDDRNVTDIIVTHHARVSVQSRCRNLSTGLRFPNQETYEHFVERLLQRAGTSYSTKRPIADGMIGNFARVHAVHRCLCDQGPYLTIRLNRYSSVDCRELARTGLAPAEVLNYLVALVQSGQTLLIAGEVGTGKTTLARALASSVPENEAILVIEDTPEIRLEHPHVRYITTREANTDGLGRIPPSLCIRGGMRMAMNRIVFGEIRDAEAAEAFVDVCASGHPGLSTIHARSAIDAVARLELFLGREQKGVERNILREQVTSAVQVIVYLRVCKTTGKRRIVEVKEIGPIADNVIRQRDIFRYAPRDGLPEWRVVTRASAHAQDLNGASLHSLPATLQCDLSELYREIGAAQSNLG